MKWLKAVSQKARTYQWIFASFLLVCISTALFSFHYYTQLQAAIRGESRDYLQEISNRISNNLNRIIEDNYASLHSVADILEQLKVTSFSTIAPILQGNATHWNYEKMVFIDANGLGYDLRGNTVALNNDTYFDAILNQKPGISNTQMVENQEVILLVVPLNGLVIDGKRMIGIAASYAPTFFEQQLSMSSFDGQAYSCVIGQTGSIIIRSKSENSIPFGYNVLTTIAQSQLDSGDSIHDVKQTLANGGSGQIGFTLDGERYYMVYTPVQPNDWFLLTFVPSATVNQKSDMLLRTTLLLCGLITLTFAGLITMLVIAFYRNKQELEQIAYVDEVTGGHTIQKFYDLAQAAVDTPEHPQYALLFTNLQKFKLLNEQWGRSTCDIILSTFHDVLQQDLCGGECIGHISADNFCLLLEYQNETFMRERIEAWYGSAKNYISQTRPVWSLPNVEFGVFVINNNNTLSFPQIIDRAKLALREFPQRINSRVSYAIYNDTAHTRLFREKYLEDRMEAALRENEFVVYLQPKYALPQQRIGGAEALVRWISKDEGMIYPTEFIPLFEKNGFIVQLDLWVFEQICKRLRIWIDAELEPVKVSVNCSRVQLNQQDFLVPYKAIAAQYRVPPELVEIELTESVVMEDVDRLAKVIDDIHAIGFGCSMDDFGSGYSSLNLIQSIPVDTLKLDRIFFHGSTKDSARMKSVLGSIVSMAKALSMSTVAEGVEHSEHVDMLQDIGCNYIQGFFFAKPMPIAEFEELAFGKHSK